MMAKILIVTIAQLATILFVLLLVKDLAAEVHTSLDIYEVMVQHRTQQAMGGIHP